MKKYPEYKESHIDWMGNIPVHWKRKRLKYFGYLYGGLSGKSGSDFNNEENSNNKQFIPFTNIANNRVIDTSQLQLVNVEDNERQNSVRNGDIFFLMSSENYDDVGKSSVLLEGLSETYLNSFCRGFRITKEDVNPAFMNYLLACQAIRNKIMVGANGFTRINLKTEKITGLSVLDVPYTEQTAIANFLDLKTQQIDDLIARKERLIELLKEERTAVINQAVTKGLDPDVPMKDSGIEWLGEIPEHWEIIQLKFLSKIRYGLGQPPKIKEDGLPMIRATNIHRGNISEEDLLFVDPDDLPYDRNPILKEGDIVVVRSGAYTADSAIITNKYSGCVTGYDMVISSNKIDQQFLSYTLLSAYVLNNQLIPVSSRAAQPHLNAEELGSTLICVPPNKEQKSISQYLIDELEHIDGVVINGEQQISYLSEYKTSLINETVTGKIDVRE